MDVRPSLLVSLWQLKSVHRQGYGVPLGGIPTRHLAFVGWLPQKKKKKMAIIEATLTVSIVQPLYLVFRISFDKGICIPACRSHEQVEGLTTYFGTRNQKTEQYMVRGATLQSM